MNWKRLTVDVWAKRTASEMLWWDECGCGGSQFELNRSKWMNRIFANHPGSTVYVYCVVPFISISSISGMDLYKILLNWFSSLCSENNLKLSILLGFAYEPFVS